MGTNLFVEGLPSPILIKVQLTREVNDFTELKEVSYALASIDDYLINDWRKLWPQFGSRRFRDINLVRFEKSSPPEFILFSDPAWIAVFLMFIIGYRNLKQNVPEIMEDIGEIIGHIKGLTERELELLEIAVRLTLERLGKETPKQEIQTLLRKFRRVYERLMGESEETPDIKIIDIDEKKRW